MSRLGDERGFIAGSLIRIVLVLAVIGLIAIEGAAVVFARLQAQDLAETSAAQGAAAFRDDRDVEGARSHAETALHDKDPAARIRSFEVDSEGNVTVVVTKRATTLVIQNIGFLEGFTVARGRHTAPPPTL